MADITRRRVGELVRGVFEILQKHPEGLAGKDVLGRMSAIVPPTAFEASEYPGRPGVRRYEKIIRFSTIAPVKAGWMVKSKGTWRLTEDGVKAFAKFRDPEQFAQEAGRLYRTWAANQPDEPEGEAETVGDLPDSKEVKVTGTLEEASDLAWADIEEHLATMPPYDFQNLVAALLRAMGYHVSWVSPPGKDGGIDIVAHNDPLGTQGPRIKVQVKRRREEKITTEGLGTFLARLGAHDVGLYVALAGFTSDAEADARREQTRKITLIDGERLVDLWIQHYMKIDEADRRLLPLRPIYYLAPE